MEHTVNFGHVQSVSNRRQIEHKLVLRQEPNRSRMCGIGEKADRRPVDPPPIIQLHVSDPSTANNRVYLHNPYYFMYATLMDERGERELNTLSDKKARTMTGSVVASLAHLKDIDGNDGAFFVFPDLSVRCEGVYRLKFSLFEIVGNQVFFCKAITSTMFTVYSAKKFPGMEESTRLTKLFAEQGLKIRVRKEPKTGRPKGARSRPIATALHSDSGPPPLHLSAWGDQHPPSSGSMSYPGLTGHSEQQQPQQYSTASTPSVPMPGGAGSSAMRPTPPGAWGSAHMQSARTAAGHALSQSPQPHPAAQFASRPDMARPPEPDALGAAHRHFRSPQHLHSHPHPHSAPGDRPPFHGHPAAGYPHPAGGPPPGSASHYRQPHPLHTGGPFPPRIQTTAQTLPPMYEPASAPGDYHEHVLPSMQYSGYHPARTSNDSGRPQPPGLGHPHRPWSPHLRAQPHFSPAPPNHPFTSDSRYSPYNRFSDLSRDGRQHVPPGMRINSAASPASEALPTYPDHQPAQGRYYQLAPTQRPVHRLSSSTPETPGVSLDHQMRGPPFSHSVRGGDHQFSAPPRPPGPPQTPRHSLVKSPSPAMAASSCARQSGLPANSVWNSMPPPAPPLVAESPQRRIAVHSLLVSDSSSSPERPQRSP